MKNPSRKGTYVYVGGKLYEARTKKARVALRQHARLEAPISRWDGEAWQETGMVLYPEELRAPAVSSKKSSAQIKREIDEVLAGKSDAPRNAARRRSKTVAIREREPAEPPYAWQRGLDMSESRRLAASLNEVARNDEARREAALLHANPPAELRATVFVDGTRLIVDTEANTGVAIKAWRALRAANVHVWDTQGSRIIIVVRDSGNNTRVEEVLAKTIDVLRGAGFVVDVDATSSPQGVRNVAGPRTRAR